MALICAASWARGWFVGRWRAFAWLRPGLLLGGRYVTNWDNVIDNAAALLGLEVRKDYRSASYSCWAVDNGAPLAGHAMAGALRLKQGGAVGVLAFGWLEFKDTCKAHAIPWESCVWLAHPDQIRRCRSVLVGKDAQKRHDWRQWAAKLPRTRDHIAGLLARTAAADLTVGKLAQVCGVSPTTARRYVNEFNLPYKRGSK